MVKKTGFVGLLLLSQTPLMSVAAESSCYGTVSKGRVEHSVKLPTSGPNFSTYSGLGAAVGRTDVHSKAAEIIAAAEGALQFAAPSVLPWRNISTNSTKPHALGVPGSPWSSSMCNTLHAYSRHRGALVCVKTCRS